MKSSSKAIEMDMPNFKILFPSSFQNYEEKPQNSHCKISLTELTSDNASENIKVDCNNENTKISVIINSSNDLQNFIIQRAIQNTNKKESKSLSNQGKNIFNSSSNSDYSYRQITKEAESNENFVCCGKPCCRYAIKDTKYDFSDQYSSRNELLPSYLPQRNNSFPLSPPTMNDSISHVPHFDIMQFNTGVHASNSNLSDFDSLQSNCGINDLNSNYRVYCSAQNSDIIENTSKVLDLVSFQSSCDMQSNYSPTEAKQLQNFSTNNSPSPFIQGEKITQLSSSPLELDFDLANTDHSFDFLYQRENYDKSCSSYSQWNPYEAQQMIPCNWV